MNDGQPRLDDTPELREHIINLIEAVARTNAARMTCAAADAHRKQAERELCAVLGQSKAKKVSFSRLLAWADAKVVSEDPEERATASALRSVLIRSTPFCG